MRARIGEELEILRVVIDRAVGRGNVEAADAVKNFVTGARAEFIPQLRRAPDEGHVFCALVEPEAQDARRAVRAAAGVGNGKLLDTEHAPARPADHVTPNDEPAREVEIRPARWPEHGRVVRNARRMPALVLLEGEPLMLDLFARH